MLDVINMDLYKLLDGCWQYLGPLLVVLLIVRMRCSRLHTTKRPLLVVPYTTAPEASAAKPRNPDIARHKSTEWYKMLFFELQNLEDYPESLAKAREELLAMFSHALSIALTEPEWQHRNSIMSIENYSADAMHGFLKDAHEKTMSDWTKYLERRKQGKGPELFTSAENAKAWLVQQAPVKFVDGAWLGHVHKITTPFALRSVTKHVWQVLSEELGDGDPDKHHVNLYRRLLKSVGSSLPSGHSAEFIHASEWERGENHGIWEAAVCQLAISLFPNEFLPEILGFNMHFEEVRLDTMQVAHELKHYGIDPYYFLIHISIDNADSGHTAMASHAVMQYLEVLRASEGEAATQRAWKRIQTGYVLSQTSGRYTRPPELNFPNIETLPTELNTQVLKIFRSKAAVSLSMHARSRIHIGRYTLHEWLEATMRMNSDGLDLLTALSRAKPWVLAGDSGRSLLVRELSWEGRMFGAFTKSEVAIICRWIDALSYKSEPSLYWTLTQRQQIPTHEAVTELRDPALHHPYLPAGNVNTVLDDFDSYEISMGYNGVDFSLNNALTEQPKLKTASRARLPDIIALWFAHISLLENTINTPSRTVDAVHLGILRILRAQAGFGIECDIVAGMDEVRRNFCPSLVDMGLELTQKLSRIAISAQPQTLKQVFILVASHGQGCESFRFANDMLKWSARPTTNLGFLLGVALAFVEFKDAVWRAPDLLSQRSRRVLQAIAAREKKSLEECARELQTTSTSLYRDLLRANYFTRLILPNCIQD
ncbi:hypothetical protein PWT90_01279 [Aphanocladium album]|nr:hypothetical protein PWT90_01279 [Aphanocladium album]